MATRIDQGAERLLTVRPRSTNLDTPAKTLTPPTRGKACSIRFHVPRDAQEQATSVYLNDKTKNYTKVAFEKAVQDQGFYNFIANSVSYEIRERSQVMHTFGGGEAVYFYGRAPIMVNLTGTLIDDLDNDQFVQFLSLYKEFLRGTKASEEYCYVELSMNNCTFTGSFLGISINQSSDRDTDIQFSAQFLAKTFTLASMDEVFTGDSGLNSPVVTVRKDDDPSLTAAQANAIIAANNIVQLNTLIEQYRADTTNIPIDPTKPGLDPVAIAAAIMEASNENTSLITPEKKSPNRVLEFMDDLKSSVADFTDELFNFDNPLDNLPTLSLGNYTKSFGTLPSVSDLIGFSAADVTEFFGDVADIISNVTAPIQDLANQVGQFAKDVIGLVESIENGIDGIIGEINSATAAVFGAIDDIENAISTICNFPDTLSSKLGSIGVPGLGLRLRIAGSENISSEEAVAILVAAANVGAARGTPEGSAAKLAVTRSNNADSSAPGLSTGSNGGDENPIPTLPPLNPGDPALRPDPSLPPGTPTPPVIGG